MNAHDSTTPTLARMLTSYRAHFCNRAYREARSEPLVARHLVDSSVMLTNSTIHTLKPMLAHPPKTGIFLSQPAVRAQNLTAWKERRTLSGFASYFTQVGVLRAPSTEHSVAQDMWSLLRDTWRIPAQQLVVRASSGDPDLLEIAQDLGGDVEVDGMEPVLYRHIFGVEGVTGRNFNFGVRTATGVKSIANIIVMERNGAPVAVEAGIGLSTTLAHVRGASHPIQASVAGSTVPLNAPAASALADALGASVPLLMETLTPGGRGPRRLLRGYLRMVKDAAHEVGTNDAQLADYAQEIADKEADLRVLHSPLAADVAMPQREGLAHRFAAALAYSAVDKSHGGGRDTTSNTKAIGTTGASASPPGCLS